MTPGQPKILWPDEAKVRALELFYAGVPVKRIARQITAEFGRACHHSTAEGWIKRAGATRAPAEFQWYPAQQELLALLRASPLCMSEIIEIRQSAIAAAHRMVSLLVDRGYVVRRGVTQRQNPKNRSRQSLYHWTGKPFPAPDRNIDDQIKQALAFQAKCEYRRSLLAEQQEHAA